MAPGALGGGVGWVVGSGGAGGAGAAGRGPPPPRPHGHPRRIAHVAAAAQPRTHSAQPVPNERRAEERVCRVALLAAPRCGPAAGRAGLWSGGGAVCGDGVAAAGWSHCCMNLYARTTPISAQMRR